MSPTGRDIIKTSAAAVALVSAAPKVAPVLATPNRSMFDTVKLGTLAFVRDELPALTLGFQNGGLESLGMSPESGNYTRIPAAELPSTYQDQFAHHVDCLTTLLAAVSGELGHE